MQCMHEDMAQAFHNHRVTHSLSGVAIKQSKIKESVASDVVVKSGAVYYKPAKILFKVSG